MSERVHVPPTDAATNSATAPTALAGSNAVAGSGSSSTAGSEPGSASDLQAATRRPVNKRMVVVGALLACVLVVGAFTTDGFATSENLRAILASIAVTGIAAVGATTIMLVGGLFSLSISTAAAACGMIFIAMLGHGIPIPLAIVGAMLAGILIQGAQGFVVGAWEANPIIVTIAAGSLLVAVATVITDGRNVHLKSTATSQQFLSETHFGVPFGVFLLLVVAALVHWLLTRTVFGRMIHFVGQSRRTAVAAALPVASTVTIAFAIAGACFALAGTLQAASFGQASISDQSSLTFDAIAAAVVGGNAITGGHGSVVRTMVGVLAIATLADLLVLRSFSAGAAMLATGVLVLVFVFASARPEEIR